MLLLKQQSPISCRIVVPAFIVPGEECVARAVLQVSQKIRKIGDIHFSISFMDRLQVVAGRNCFWMGSRNRKDRTGVFAGVSGNHFLGMDDDSLEPGRSYELLLPFRVPLDFPSTFEAFASDGSCVASLKVLATLCIKKKKVGVIPPTSFTFTQEAVISSGEQERLGEQVISEMEATRRGCHPESDLSASVSCWYDEKVKCPGDPISIKFQVKNLSRSKGIVASTANLVQRDRFILPDDKDKVSSTDNTLEKSLVLVAIIDNDNDLILENELGGDDIERCAEGVDPAFLRAWRMAKVIEPGSTKTFVFRGSVPKLASEQDEAEYYNDNDEEEPFGVTISKSDIFERTHGISFKLRNLNRSKDKKRGGGAKFSLLNYLAPLIVVDDNELLAPPESDCPPPPYDE